MESTRQLYADHYLVTHRASPAEGGIRLDVFLKNRYRRRSREMLKKAISSGCISIQRSAHPQLKPGRAKASSMIMAGDEILVMSERKPEPAVNFDYKILFEDEDLFIIDKPANLPVHPAGRFFFNTLLTHLRTQGFTQALHEDEDFFLVHRIDKDTSGVLILTKNSVTCGGITQQFRNRTTQKKYLAITHGEIAENEIRIDVPIARSTTSKVRIKMEPSTLKTGGLTAETHVKVLERKNGFSLVECFPKTGRQHQIRVHLASIGHSIVGDRLYSVTDDEAFRIYGPEQSRRANSFLKLHSLKKNEAGLPALPHLHIPPEIEMKLMLSRHALHAASIEFIHPRTGKKLKFEAPLSADLVDFFNSTPLAMPQGLRSRPPEPYAYSMIPSEK